MWPFCSPLYSKHSPQLNLSLLTPSFLAFFWNKHSSGLKPPVFASNHLQITASCSHLLLGISFTSEVCLLYYFQEGGGGLPYPILTLLKEGLQNATPLPPIPPPLVFTPSLHTPFSPHRKSCSQPFEYSSIFSSLPLFSLKSNRLDRLISCDWKHSNLWQDCYYGRIIKSIIMWRQI